MSSERFLFVLDETGGERRAVLAFARSCARTYTRAFSCAYLAAKYGHVLPRAGIYPGNTKLRLSVTAVN